MTWFWDVWHQLNHMQTIRTSLQADDHVSNPPLCFFTGRMPFLLPNQQRQSTEGINSVYIHWVNWRHSIYGHYGHQWLRGVVVSGVRQWTKLTHVGPGYNWDGRPSSGGYTISGCNQPTRSTQPCIPPGSLNRVPASAGVKAGMSPLPGGR